MSNRVTGLAKSFDNPDDTSKRSNESRVRGLATKFNAPSSHTTDVTPGAKVGDIASRFGKQTLTPSIPSTTNNTRSLTNQTSSSSKPKREILRERMAGEQENEDVPFEKASRRFRDGNDSDDKSNKAERKMSIHEKAKVFESQESKKVHAKTPTKVADVTKKFAQVETSSGQNEEKQSAFASASAAFKEREAQPEREEVSSVSNVARRFDGLALDNKENASAGQDKLNKTTSLPPTTTKAAKKESTPDADKMREVKKFASSNVSTTASIFEKSSGGGVQGKIHPDEATDSPTEITARAKQAFDSPPKPSDDNTTEGRKSRFTDACKAFSMG
eukprot:Plantae.Rhodophyta-Hildenbrandia_rubra.ctg3891.p2 GENE.Plantae.Rhodophyta-Hildenbrandia_rubra.ctg3891~~Plantae.Rhodophyta-Hildenbrandia_rubra.ctg3891.p2  ORF type:complete len:331 (-),score=81.96 Plantae.Rhodophyta-Hildenbrandia_rubra.ctg3891:3240-4232(-)